MISVALAAVWRFLTPFQKQILWLLNSKFTLGVCVVIFNNKGEVWLQQHRFWPDQSWGLPGGHVNYDESTEDAVRRELLEETGLQLTEISLLHAEKGWRKEFVVYFTGKLAEGELHLDDKEILAADYFSIDSLPKPMLRTHRPIIEMARRKLEELP